MILKIEEEYKEYGVVIFAVQGNTYLVLVRHRVYTAIIHANAGGLLTVEMLKYVVQASVATTTL